MYRDFYGLNKKPFQISADPEFLWLGPKHDEGLSILLYGVRDNKGFLVLSGGVGTGKTTLIHALHEHLDDSVVVATVPDPGLELIEFYRFIAASFGMEGEYQNKVDFLLGFEDFLNEIHAQGRIALLIIDEAQRLTSAMLEEVRLLSNIETPKQKLLNIFFVGQEEFFDIIATPQNRALRHRITINYHLDALSLEETRTLIAYRLKVAGATEPIFDDEAIESVYRCSQGHPRRINILCDHALLTGFVKNCRTIGADIITECSSELMLPGESSVVERSSMDAGTDVQLESDTKPVERVPPKITHPAPPAILKKAFPDKAPLAVLLGRQSRQRILLVATAICLTVLAAVLFFKPQRLRAPSSPSEAIATAPRTGIAQAETAAPNLEVAAPQSLQPKEIQSDISQDTTEEAPDDAESISPTTFTEPTTAEDPQPETSAQTPETIVPDQAEVPPDLEGQIAANRAPNLSDDDGAMAAPSQDAEAAQMASDRPAETVDETHDRFETADEKRVFAETALTDESAATLDRLPQHEAPLPPEVSDDFRSAKAVPDSTPSPLVQTNDSDPSEAIDQDEYGRFARQMPSEPVADTPVAPLPDAAPTGPPPASAPIQPEESRSATSEQQAELTDQAPESDRTRSRAPDETAAVAPDNPPPAEAASRPESEPPTPRPAQPAPPPTVEKKPLVAATTPTATAPLKDEALQPPTTAEQLNRFLQNYCRLYSSKNIEGFAALFTPDAIERDRPFAEMIPVYRANFEKLTELSYQIDMKTYKESPGGRAIRVKGDFKLLYRLEGQDFKTSDGVIEMDLVKLNNEYRVKRLDYRKGK